MTYDYLILGGGAASLSLAYRMIDHSYFKDKRIAIVEPQEKITNDRTWCFWEKSAGIFEDVIFKEWRQLSFYSSEITQDLDMGDYTYKMIRSIDFYNHILPRIHASPIEWIKDEVVRIEEYDKEVVIIGHHNTYKSNQVFQSFLLEDYDNQNHIHVDQHFKGYFIETAQKHFDANRATFMDFRIKQNGETRFMYVLPTSPYEALVEVAIFSNNHLTEPQYDDILINHIENCLDINEYEVKEEEHGVIPMTTYPYYKNNTDKICFIGTAGGAVKAASGYAFRRMQEHSDRLVDHILKGENLAKASEPFFNRFHRYDEIFLDAILGNATSGEEVFTKLFQTSKAYEIFKFLDQETSFREDINIFKAPPTWPFMKSFFRTL